jgi:hypothetical protein
MSMTDIRVTPEAQAALDKLSKEQPEQAQAVRAAMNGLDTETAEPLHIPSAPPGTPFLALKTSLPDAPVVVYRRTTPDEPGDWLVVSLLSPKQYQQLRRAEETLDVDPGAREIFTAVVAGTVPTSDATTPAGTPTITPTGGAVPTTGPDAPARQ